MPNTSLFCIAVVCLATSIASGKEPSLRDKVQCKWVRTNHPFAFQVRGNNWEHYEATKPLQATSKGIVEYPAGKDYAVVKTDTGHVWWIWSAGRDVVAVETFEPDGSFGGGALGRIFYRPGSDKP